MQNIKTTCKMRSDEEKAALGRQEQWRALRTKLDVILRNTKIFTRDQSQAKCRELDNMNLAERQAFILSEWGQLYLDEAVPVLLQLEILETA